MSYSVQVGEDGATIPLELLEKLGVAKGESIDVIVDEASKKAVVVATRRENPVDKWSGALAGSFSSIEEINEWIRDMREE
jgi:bifunctional DNA-binding transcriptional regulator/antitoxin component of YhaV-PrlF toxin-antitoxin module